MNRVWCSPGREIVLASASPRRRDIFRRIGLEFRVVPADGIDEKGAFSEASDIQAGAELASERKAEMVADKYRSSIVIGSDTVVAAENKALFKPGSRDEAYEMLKLLSGRRHLVITGVSVVVRDLGYKDTCSAVTEVYFRSLSEREILMYLEEAEYMDKAGGYAIQEEAAAFIEKINGCFYNVVGVPVAETIRMLDKFIKENGEIYG